MAAGSGLLRLMSTAAAVEEALARAVKTFVRRSGVVGVGTIVGRAVTLGDQRHAKARVRKSRGIIG